MIRIATPADIDAMLAIYGPYILDTTYSFEYTIPTREEFLQRFQDYTRQFPWLVWEEQGEILGYAYGSAPFGKREAYRWCAEASVYLKPESHRQGIGRQLYAALEAILTHQGYRVVYALITSENIPSLAFHAAMGYVPRAEFTRCGYKFGRWLGVHWYEKPLASVEFPSNYPIPWETLVPVIQILFENLDILSLS